MSGYVSSKHDPPQVLTVVAITCRQCGGEQSYRNQDDILCACNECENGYEKVMVDAQELHSLCAGNPDPKTLHRAVVEMAEANHVRLPVLTRNTALLATHLLPRTPRIPLTKQSRVDEK